MAGFIERTPQQRHLFIKLGLALEMHHLLGVPRRSHYCLMYAQINITD
jgi:hypothetical protein